MSYSPQCTIVRRTPPACSMMCPPASSLRFLIAAPSACQGTQTASIANRKHNSCAMYATRLLSDPVRVLRLWSAGPPNTKIYCSDHLVRGGSPVCSCSSFARKSRVWVRTAFTASWCTMVGSSSFGSRIGPSPMSSQRGFTRVCLMTEATALSDAPLPLR